MLQWIQMNLATIVIATALVVMVGAIVWYLRRQKKQGKSSCGGNCAHCAMCGTCHTEKKPERG